MDWYPLWNLSLIHIFLCADAVHTLIFAQFQRSLMIGGKSRLCLSLIHIWSSIPVPPALCAA